MRMFAVVVALLLGISSSLADPVRGRQILVNPNFACTGTNLHLEYIIPDGYTAQTPMRVVKLQMWFGLWYGGWADFVGVVRRWSDGSPMADGSHDDYVNGGSVRIHSQDWGGNQYVFLSGDRITLDTSCLGSPSNLHGGISVWIWFKE